MKWEDDGSLSVERLSWNIPSPKNWTTRIAPTATENSRIKIQK